MTNTAILRQGPLGVRYPTEDPFIFTVHHTDDYPAGDGNSAPATQEGRGPDGEGVEMLDGVWHMYHGRRVPGFPAHPHRGFETVSVVEEGTVDHSDGYGNSGRYSAGDVQWMTAGAGMQHAEMIPLVNTDKGNRTDWFQIWLNLPPEKKMAPPAYKMLWREDIPIVVKGEAGQPQTTVKVVAGVFEGVQAVAPAPDSWAADSANKVNIWVALLDSGASLTLPAVSKTLSRMLYLVEGSAIDVAGTTSSKDHYMKLVGDREILVINNGDDRVKVLLLEGEPIGAPVVAYGTFVMNTRDEVEQAYADFQRDHFGGWPYPVADPVHTGKGRFALGEIKEK